MIRLGIISLEHPHAAGNHLPALKYMQDRVQTAAIYDEDKGTAKPWLKMFGAKYYQTREELLADTSIDTVLITSTNDRHAQDCIDAARAGKNILCDKPIATSVADAVRLAREVRENHVICVNTLPVRFNSTVLQTRKWIEAGELGRITAIAATNHGCMYESGCPQWVLDPEKNGGGCIIDHTVHVADLIRWFTGEEFETVTAYARHALHDNLPASTEDIAVMHGTMSNGTIFQIDASWSRRPQDPMWGDVTLRIVGEKGAAFLDLYNTQRMEVYRDGECKLYYPNLVARDHGNLFDDYISHVEHGSPLLGADEEDALRVVELAYAAYDSVKAGKEVPVIRNAV